LPRKRGFCTSSEIGSAARVSCFTLAALPIALLVRKHMYWYMGTVTMVISLLLQIHTAVLPNGDDNVRRLAHRLWIEVVQAVRSRNATPCLRQPLAAVRHTLAYVLIGTRRQLHLPSNHRGTCTGQ
jgi:hypothetical protein